MDRDPVPPTTIGRATRTPEGAHDCADPVLACSLAAGDHGARLSRWHDLIGATSIERRGLDAMVSLPVAAATRAVDLIVAEHECCPFLTFRIDVARGALTLTISAPNQAGLGFVDALMPDRTH